MIRRDGFGSWPVDRLRLEFTDSDVRVLEWLRGRTTSLPDIAAGRVPAPEFCKPAQSVTENEVRGFLQRLWDATGHMRCCSDLSPAPKKAAQGGS